MVQKAKPDGCEDCSLAFGGSIADLLFVGISEIMFRLSLVVDGGIVNWWRAHLSVP